MLRQHHILLSGGSDSTTLVAWVQHHHPGDEVSAVTFLYGQKHAVELEAARAVAAHYGVRHREVELPRIEGSALTDVDSPLPEDGTSRKEGEVAPTYVPARNLLFIASLASLADAVGPGTLWLGVHQDDRTGYPDCSPGFVEAAGEAVRQGTEYGLDVQAPFVTWPKSEILRWGCEHQAPYHLTHSCYKGLRPACGVCDTCRTRREAFAAVGVEDPVPYADGV